MQKAKARKKTTVSARKRNRETKQVTEADIEKELALATRVEALLQKGQAGSDVAKRDTLTLSTADGKAVTGCSAGNERLFAQWLFGGLYPVLVERDDALDGSKIWMLEATRSVLLSSEPKTPLEAMLISQAMAIHELCMAFGRRALQAKHSDVSGKLAERFARLADTACRQAECIQKLRGEAGKQHVTVQHLTVEEGGKALVGQVNTPGEGTQK